MHSKYIGIISLLIVLILSPVVDAIACDDCKDVLPVREERDRLAANTLVSNDTMTADAGHAEPDERGSAQDLCPVCANSAVTIVTSCCCAPSLVCQSADVPKLLVLSDPSYPINKPPQN